MRLARRGLARGASACCRIARELLAAARAGEPRRARRGAARARLPRGRLRAALGRRSRYYLDKYRFETRPDLLGPLGELIAAAVREHEPDAVRLAGPELGAVALAAAASLVVGPAVPDRPQGGEGVRHRQPARGRLRAGRARLPRRGRRHLRRARRSRRSRRCARPASRSRTAVCVVDREEGGADALARLGVRLRPLFRPPELLELSKSAAKPHG